MYFGDGPHNPSVIQRLSRVEDVMDNIKDIGRKAVGLLFSILAVALGNLLLHIFWK